MEDLPHVNIVEAPRAAQDITDIDLTVDEGTHNASRADVEDHQVIIVHNPMLVQRAHAGTSYDGPPRPTLRIWKSDCKSVGDAACAGQKLESIPDRVSKIIKPSWEKMLLFQPPPSTLPFSMKPEFEVGSFALGGCNRMGEVVNKIERVLDKQLEDLGMGMDFRKAVVFGRAGKQVNEWITMKVTVLETGELEQLGIENYKL